MKNLLLIGTLFMLLVSCQNKELEDKVALYEELYPSLKSLNVKEFKLRLEKQEKFDSTFKKNLRVKSTLGGEITETSKIVTGIRLHQGFRQSLMKTPIPDDVGFAYSTSVSTSFFMGISKMKEMVDKYDSLNIKTGEKDSSKWPIQGIGVFIYIKDSIMGEMDNHTDIVFFPVNEKGEILKKIKIIEKGKMTTVDVPPYNSSIPCPTC